MLIFGVWFGGLPIESVIAETSSRPDCHVLTYHPDLGSASVAKSQEFFNELYKRVGLCAWSEGVPPNRIKQRWQADKIDGDWFRIEGYADTKPDVWLELPQPIFEIAMEFLWLEQAGFDGTPADLEGRVVGYRQGLWWLEKNLPLYGAQPWPLFNKPDVLKLLQRGRMDVYVSGSVNIAQIQMSPEIAELPHKTALWKMVPVYHLVHVRHRNVIPVLNKALIEMIRSGEAAKIFDLPGLAIARLK